jgi:hypothetical protein
MRLWWRAKHLSLYYQKNQANQPWKPTAAASPASAASLPRAVVFLSAVSLPAASAPASAVSLPRAVVLILPVPSVLVEAFGPPVPVLGPVPVALLLFGSEIVPMLLLGSGPLLFPEVVLGLCLEDTVPVPCVIVEAFGPPVPVLLLGLVPVPVLLLGPVALLGPVPVALLGFVPVALLLLGPAGLVPVLLLVPVALLLLGPAGILSEVLLH